MGRILAFFRERYLEILLLYLAIQFGFVAAGGWLEDRRWVAGIAFAAILVGLPAGFYQRERSRRRRWPAWAADHEVPTTRRGVVFTLGLGPYDQSLCPWALSHLAVEFVGLLATRALRPDYRDGYVSALGKLGKTVRVVVCTDDQRNDLRAGADQLLRWLLEDCGLTPDDVVVDLTHGTTLMSVGAFVAAQDRGVDCQYVHSSFEDRRRIPGSERPILLPARPV